LIPRDPLPPGNSHLPDALRLDPTIGAILYRLHDFKGRHLKANIGKRGLLRIGKFGLSRENGPFMASAPGCSHESSGSKEPAQFADRRKRKSGCPTCGPGRRRGEWNEGNVFSFDKRHAMHRFHKRYRAAIGFIIGVLLLVASYGYWERGALQREIARINSQGVQLETRQAASGDEYLQLGRLINRVVSYGAPAQTMKSLLSEDEFIRREMNLLLREFGAEEYDVPPEFLHEVSRFIRQYQVRDHDLVAHALVNDRESLEQIRGILRRDNLPQDLAYMALVESGFLQSSASEEGAAGVWQFTEATARDYGMEVSEGVDERLDLSKSTEAASRYIRDLILDFGAGSSVMLAMAAYNSGPEKVRRAVRNVKDPIKQRNFWYLYQTHALPDETRAYVPKVFAAIIIGRNPRHFGF